MGFCRWCIWIYRDDDLVEMLGSGGRVADKLGLRLLPSTVMVHCDGEVQEEGQEHNCC